MQLYLILFVVSFLSLVYELLLSTQGSYLLGSSIVVFSVTIGFFLLGLGLGAFLATFFRQTRVSFFFVELLLGLLGGMSLVLLKYGYLSFGSIDVLYRSYYLFLVLAIGTLTGCEPTLIASMIDESDGGDIQYGFKQLFGRVLSVDYLGSLIATLLFPFILLPYLGLDHTVLVLGGINLGIAGWFAFRYLKQTYHIIRGCISLVYIVFGMFQWIHGDGLWNQAYFDEPVIYETHTPYQHVHITQKRDYIRLYLDGNIQFDSRDHHRYHQSLMDPVSAYNRTGAALLILGGGDGLLADQISQSLVDRSISFSIDLVELDPGMIDIARHHPKISQLNHHIFDSDSVQVHIEDAFQFVRDVYERGDTYDIIIADFPDPRTTELATLYGDEFYSFIRRILSREGGIFVTQASNAYMTNDVFACISASISEVWDETHYRVMPYHSFIPAWGDRGFVSVYPAHRGSTPITYGSDVFDADYATHRPCKNSTDYNELPLLYQQGWSH